MSLLSLFPGPVLVAPQWSPAPASPPLLGWGREDETMSHSPVFGVLSPVAAEVPLFFFL